jgi:hypothetical protein
MKRFAISAIVFSIMIILIAGLSIMTSSGRLYAERPYSAASTTNQIPTQSNTAIGDDNRLQNCAQTSAGKQNDQSLDCKQNSIREDTEETRGIALLTVIKEVRCGGPFFPISSNICFPSAYTIHVEGNDPSPSSFAGSSAGTTVILGEGEYSVTESKPILPMGPEIISTLSPDCSGFISLGQSKTCIITNEVNTIILPSP